MNMLKNKLSPPLALGILFLPHLGAMEQPKDSLESFDIRTSMGDFHFRKVDFNNLSEKDQESYFSHTADFEAIQQMLGTVPACVFRPLLCFVPSLAYDMIVQERAKKADISNNHTQFDWFSEQNNKFVGHISLTGINTDVPQEIITKIGKTNDTNLWSGSSLFKDYRGKGIARQLCPLVLEQLDNAPALKGKSILFGTRADNKQVHILAEKNGFTFIGSAMTSLDLGLYKQNLDVDYFVHHIT